MHVRKHSMLFAELEHATWELWAWYGASRYGLHAGLVLLAFERRSCGCSKDAHVVAPLPRSRRFLLSRQGFSLEV